MIDRLNVAGIPIQQRSTTDDGNRVNPIKIVEKADSTNHQFEKNNQQQNEQQKKEKVESVVKSLNDFLQPAHTSIKFKLHEKLNQYYVTIIDDNTNEVIKEVPAKKLLDAYAAMAERLGFLIDRKI
jgi:flagellar protein FlaG